MLTANQQEIVLKVKSFHPYYINMFMTRLSEHAGKMLNVKLEQAFLPSRYERFTLLKSPHVDKKAREQFERVTHKRLISVIITQNNSNKSNLEELDKMFRLIQTLSVGIEIDFQTTSKSILLKNH